MRSERSRAAVVEALLDLLEEGDLRPTAARVAERAGVSLRTVFLHFRDLEALFAAAADRQLARLAHLAPRLQSTGPLTARLARFVKQRAELLETIAPVRRASLLMEPFSREIAARLAGARRLARAQVEQAFAPELALLAARERREVGVALAASTSFSSWEVLRRHHGLSVERARKVMTRMLRALLHAAEPCADGAVPPP
jgi:AcrR family transcriptional regulator